MEEEASGIPGFRAAYTAGSTNWLPGDAEMPRSSDLDIMIVLASSEQAGTRRKFVDQDTLLEVSYLGNEMFQSPDRILGDYHLAPSLSTTKVVHDPKGDLTPLLEAVSRDFAKRDWVRRRCVHARQKVFANLQSIVENAPIHDRITACLFAAGITTHILLTAGLRNPTVRSRYLAVRELLVDYGHAEFQETLLKLLGSVRIDRARASQHLLSLVTIYDAASAAMKTPFPFASDISHLARPIAIDGVREMIEHGNHREAMFWIGVTHSRCQKVLSLDAPENLGEGFRDGYHGLIADLGLSAWADVGRRRAEIERALPKVCDVAEEMIAANTQIEDP